MLLTEEYLVVIQSSMCLCACLVLLSEAQRFFLRILDKKEWKEILNVSL